MNEAWTEDACSLVDAFRRGERSPREELESSLAAIGASDLNAFSHLDPELALDAADHADISKPFGGVPVGIKELEPVAGWPQTEGSLVFKNRIATKTSTVVQRLLGQQAARHPSGSPPLPNSAGSTSASRSSTASRTTRGATAAPLAARRPAPRPRSRAGSSRSQPAATGAAPFASPRATPVSSA